MPFSPAVPRPAPRSPSAPIAPDVLDLSVVIVNYNVREFLEQALRSVRRAGEGLATEVFVVDNDSVDGSQAMVREHFPEVHLIANRRNVGFGRANNQAIRQARGRYLLILNPDTLLQEDTLRTLVAFMDRHPEAGAAGCRILNPDGSFAPESRRAFPTPEVAFYRMSGLGRLFPHHPRFGRYNMTFLPRDQVAEVDALSGSCMMVRRAALYENGSAGGREDERTGGRTDGGSAGAREAVPNPGSEIRDSESGAGLFDEDFFMYGEDLDWCYRIQQAGWKIYYTPETQIIHYKGESTKKGDLRYVRLFYGAMLQFTEKHLESRYSGLMALALRGAILGRAALSMAGQATRRLARPALDAALVAAVVVAVALAYGSVRGVALVTPSLLLTVVPAFALATVLSVTAAGGYRPARRTRLRPVWTGVLAGTVLTAAASFFVKDIAFSRALVALSGVLAGVLLAAVRLAAGMRRRGPRRALLAGPPAEAHRLQRMLAHHPDPPLDLVGYAGPPPNGSADAPPRLGALHQVRDLVRLGRIEEVVFAADGVTTRTVLGLMQELRDLPVRCTILAAGRSHVIGKASVEDLATPALLEAEEAVGRPRSRAARRAFELPITVLGLLLHPLVALAAHVQGAGCFFSRLAVRTRRLPDVLRGRRALIGYDPEAPYRPPAEWDLLPGVFTVTDTLATGALDAEHAGRLYWHYVVHQSAALDADILFRAVQALAQE